MYEVVVLLTFFLLGFILGDWYGSEEDFEDFFFTNKNEYNQNKEE